MKLRTKIYTTSKSLWPMRHFDDIYPVVDRARGVEVHSFHIQHFDLPKEVPTFEVGGGVYIDWKWLKQNLPSKGYSAVCLHISRRERDELGLRHPKYKKGIKLGGVYNPDPDDVFDFVVIADKDDRSYVGSEFERIFLHELSHGFSRWRGVTDYTHLWDYTLKAIRFIFYFHDFTAWNKLQALIIELRARVAALMNQVDLQNLPDAPKEEVENKEDFAQRLYEAAVASLGTDASPNDAAPDELGCADTVSNIIKRVVPSFPVITGTWTLWDRFEKDDRFERIAAIERGAIIICATVPGKPFPGHVGIMGDDGE
ncbi:MAG: hypothetical protein MI867_04345, partial [Pseudomonadales bacterium]|nr:hypothetical protein [Pseudomonadales bacterium]